MNDDNQGAMLPKSGDTPSAGGAASWLAPALIFGSAAVLAAGMFQAKRSKSAEEAHPPIGRFLKVGGTTVHYADIGEGPPVVFLHGLGLTMEDWFISGVLDALLPLHRVIVIDRPGYGYSRRPNGRHTPEREARLLADMLHRLGAHDAVIVGHSAGVLPAIVMALTQSHMVRALVLLGGAYYPGATVADVTDTMPEVPGVGGLLRATVTPSLARAAMPALIDRLFEPQIVTNRFRERFPIGLVTRPQQLRTTADDAAEVNAVLKRLSPHYERLDIPVTVIAGSGDAVVDPDTQSRAFADAVDHARLIVVPAMGHMVHHSAPERVAAAIVDTFTGEVDVDDPGPPPDLSHELLKPDTNEGDDADAITAEAADEDADGEEQGTTSTRKSAAKTGAKGGTRRRRTTRSGSKTAATSKSPQSKS